MRDVRRERVEAIEDVGRVYTYVIKFSRLCAGGGRGKYQRGRLGRTAAGVYSTENRSASGLALPLEKDEQVVPDEDVQIDGDLEKERGRGKGFCQ